MSQSLKHVIIRDKDDVGQGCKTHLQGAFGLWPHFYAD